LARIITENVKKYGNKNDYVCHIGGDDFVVVSTPEKARKIAEEICSMFDKYITFFYDEVDRKRQKIISLDRKGVKQEYPLASVSIAIVTNKKRQLFSVAQVSQIASELKRYAKKKRDGMKSNYVEDRRKE
jgi:GGDEF domain-containing protein